MSQKYFHSLLIITLLLLSFSASAQNSLTGKVYNKKTNALLQNAILQITDLKVAAVTDSNGVYTFNNIPKGNYLLEIDMLGYAAKAQVVKVEGASNTDFALSASSYEEQEVVVTGNSGARSRQLTPQPTTEVTNEYLNENSATNVIDAIANVPGVSAMTDGQSISKPMIRGLGYNRVLTINDGVEQMDQAWFDEFGIEVDPDAVNRAEILKGPASLAYGSDAISGVINLIPEAPMPEGVSKGEILSNYQTNNGLINNMFHLTGTKKGISWSARVDHTMAHAYQNSADGYVLNSQFSNTNMDGTLGLHRKWGYTQLHASYFDMATGIVDGTRDSTGALQRQVSYPDLNGGAPTFETPTRQEAASYTPFVIYQRIRHSKVVWDNSIAVGSGRISGLFSFQQNDRQETNDPTMPNTPDIYYKSQAATYDLRYISAQMGNFNFSAGVNGAYQQSQSLGTVQLIPDYNFFQVGGFVIASEQIGKLNISGGIRYDNRTFTGNEHWIDTTNVAQAPVPANTAGSFEEFKPFTTNYGGVSGSLGATYNFTNGFYLKANIARGYRAPNVSECGAYGVHDGTVVFEIGTPTLQSEQSLQEDFTIGVTTRDVSFEASAFNNSIDNFIYARHLLSSTGGDTTSNALSVGGNLFPDAPIFVFTQGKAQLYGGEVMLNIHPSAIPWVELNADYSMVSGGLQNVSDSIKFLPFVPPARMNATLKFHAKQIGKGIKNAYFKIGVQSVFQQNDIYKQYSDYTGLNTLNSPEEYAASRAAQPGYTLLNAGIGGDIQSNGRTFCKLYVNCTNLTDEVYMDYMSRFKYLPVNPVTHRVGTFNMGRNFSIKMIIPFDFSKKK